MEQQRYKVIFRGKVTADRTVTEVKQALASLMQARVYQIEKLFSGQPVVIKKQVSSEVAAKYVAAFREAGAVVEVKPHTRPVSTLGVVKDDDETAVEWDAPAMPGVEHVIADPPPTVLTTKPAALEEPAMSVPAHNPYADDPNPVLAAIGFVIKLILSLAFTGVVVAILVLLLLSWTGGLQFFGFNSINEVLAALQQLLQ